VSIGSPARQVTGGDGTHAVLEAVGHRPAYDMAVGVVRVGGVISRVGVPQYEDAPVGFGRLFGRNLTLAGPAPVRAYRSKSTGAGLLARVGRCALAPTDNNEDARRCHGHVDR
jgi:threonine dehydrogenase-like Zn-dependent dehydrogenase